MRCVSLVCIVEDLRTALRYKDNSRIYSSSFCPLYKDSVIASDEILYISVDLRTNRLRHQLRVMFWGRVVNRFSSGETCKTCRYGGTDAWDHFLLLHDGDRYSARLGFHAIDLFIFFTFSYYKLHQHPFKFPLVL